MSSSFTLARSLPHAFQQFRHTKVTLRHFSILSNSGPKIRNAKIQTLDFCGVKEKVYESSDWPKEKYQNLFKNDTIAMIGYGSQGSAQSLNARDNGLNVIVGVREGGKSWNEAIKDDLFSINDALAKGTIINNLLSDAAQKELWPQFITHLKKGKTLCFCHGFSIIYKEYTNVIPPTDIDVVMIAPKGSGKTLRSLFLDGRGMNSSVAIFQDVTGEAMDKAVAFGVAIGSAYLYETTFQREVFADLVGERGVLLGAIQVADGSETRRVLEKNSSPTYAEDLEEELKEISEIWRTGKIVRKLRPENKK
ncbi:2363_t:CDS:2 [Racocetra fulgida]|uniref:2363_t:CDS:1 n=1 Tax=Racocetra fulgida TaxID=60492 RepID=A0A9N8ZNS5_9GLOM|nr:2363_t:CDS:2 [Racocetra fulgida]